MRNKESLFRDFYSWYFKDWYISGARARLTLPQRANYLDLLGFCYTEGRITADKRVLLSRLGIGAEHEADLSEALKEFEPAGDGQLTRPRVLIEAERLEAARTRRSRGGIARAAKVTPPQAEVPGFSFRKAQPRRTTDDREDPF